MTSKRPSSDTPYMPIACDAHDHLEIACLHRYTLRIDLIDGSVLVAVAQTTKTVKNEGEFLEVLVDGAPVSIRLDRLRKITVQDPRAQFGSLEF